MRDRFPFFVVVFVHLIAIAPIKPAMWFVIDTRPTNHLVYQTRTPGGYRDCFPPRDACSVELKLVKRSTFIRIGRFSIQRLLGFSRPL